ncbi:MAG: helix-turn-helix domain containing protein [Actinomycetota bacterium]|nr:helix-turn-helix domain containing protein [Actinomycetota bacterium]
MTKTGDATKRALIEASAQLLIEEGASAITTRRVADRAGVNQALVHYHFGTVDSLLVAVVERMSAAVSERSASLYDHQSPVHERWRDEVAQMLADFDAGWPKIWLEAVTLAANRDDLRETLVHAMKQSRQVREQAVAYDLGRLGVDTRQLPVSGVTTLMEAISTKLIIDRLLGIDTGHDEMLRIVDRLAGLMESAGSQPEVA